MSPSQKIKTARWTVRILFLAGSIALVVLADNPARLHGILPAFSPFLALIALVTGGASLMLLPSVVVLVICFFKKRFFCRWVCPAGTCFEIAGSKMPKHRWVSRVPRMGIWLLALGVGTATVGFPLFVVLDPLSIFSSAFGWIRPELTLWEKIGACVFPAMIILAALAPWFWCGRLCPLGALQDVASEIVKWICALRPSGSSGDSPSHASRPADKTPGKKDSSRAVDTGRRIFLGLGIGAAYRLLLNTAKLEADAAVIRPPVCGGEARFTRLCARCGACARACPDQIIIQGNMESGFAGLLAPELDFSRAGCAPECTRCGEACPTGAIPKFTEKDKFAHPLGVAVVKKELCVLSNDRECGVCMNACPHGAINIAWDPVEMESVLDIDDKLCTGCGICEYVCPERPVAIVIEKQRAEHGEDDAFAGHGRKRV